MSPCARVDAKTLVEKYIEAGYDGIYITDHFFAKNDFNNYYELSWRDFIDNHFSGYEAVSEAANGRIDVFCGAELRILTNINDYLVYGVDKNFFYEHDLIKMTLCEVYDAIKGAGGLLFQAHPFRNNMVVTSPKYLDGIEVYNGNARQESRNTIAQVWADKFDLLKISGSDFHELEDLARGGILTPVKIKSERDFAEVIRSKNYSLIETL